MLTTNSGIIDKYKEGLLAEQLLNQFDSDAEESNFADARHPDYSKYEITAIPSHQIMQKLLDLFSGRKSKNTENVIQEKIVKESYDEFNQLMQQTEQTAIISNSRLVHGTAFIPEDLFKDNLTNREEELAVFIQKTFGAEGLRHFLGLIIGLEENGRKGEYSFSMNKHLERLGYSRSKGGSFSPDLKRKAFQIIQVLCSLLLTIKWQGKDKQQVTTIKLFNLNRVDMERNLTSTDYDLTGISIQANDAWYGSAFRKTDKCSQQYTKLLKKVASENHKKHPFVLYLAIRFAISWRMNSYQPVSLKVSTIMDKCCIDYSKSNRSRMRDLRLIESELNHMAEQGYLGEWFYKENCREGNLFERVVVLVPPVWIKQKEIKVPAQKGMKVEVSLAGLKWLQKQTGLNQSQLAEKLGVSRQHLSAVFKERKDISLKLSQRITEVFGHLFEEVSTKSCPSCCETLPLVRTNPALAAASENRGPWKPLLPVDYSGTN